MKVFRRRSILIAASLICLLVFSSVAPYVFIPNSVVSAAETLVTYKANTSLYYRDKPSTSGAVKGTLSSGEKVSVVKGYSKEANNYTWYKIKISGNYYYVASEFLTKVNQTVVLLSYKTTDEINYRSKPGLSGKIIGTIKKGTKVSVVKGYSKTVDNYTWYKIKISGKYYYAVKNYLKKIVAVSSVSLNKSSASIKKGSSITLSASVLPSNATNKRITWSSSNKSIATVSSSGVVKALSAGTAVITAKTTNGIIAKCKITVPASSSSTVTLLKYITTSSLNYRTKPSTSASIKGTLSKGKKVYVVKGYKKSADGYTWYKLKINGEYYYAVKNYLKKQVASTSIALNYKSKTLTVGASLTVIPTLTPSNSTDSVKWTSSDTTVATVSQSGIIKAVKKGTAVITAKTTSGKTAKVSVTVKNSSSSASTTTYFTTTAVYYRKSPSTSGETAGLMSSGSSVEVVDGYSKSSDGYTWYKIKVNGNYYYMVSKYLSTSTSSSDSTSLPVGKTLYLNYYSGGTWSTSDSSVATVTNGYVYGVKKGKATISWTSGSTKKSWSINVTAAEPVRYAYASPNVSVSGSNVTFVAITDTQKKSVRFTVNGESVLVTDYTTETAAAKNGFAANSCRIWKYKTKLSGSGDVIAKIYSSTSADGSNMSSKYVTATAYLSGSALTTSSLAERHISEKGLKFIASFEGYVPTVTNDPLTGTITPTLGYGYVVTKGEQFYNNLTKAEAWAMLCNASSNSYTSAVNKFISNNNIKANQNQFDSMVSFSYNCGSGWWNGSSEFDLRVFLLNAVNPKSVQNKITAGSTVTGVTSFSTNTYTSNKVKTSVVIPAGSKVKIISAAWDSTNKLSWYKVTYNSKNYYVHGSCVQITSHSFQKDMNYMDAYVFGSELLQWHHAGGTCYKGLVYRRNCEAKMFSFANYSYSESTKSSNTYGYAIPSCISGYGWLN